MGSDLGPLEVAGILLLFVWIKCHRANEHRELLETHRNTLIRYAKESEDHNKDLHELQRTLDENVELQKKLRDSLDKCLQLQEDMKQSLGERVRLLDEHVQLRRSHARLSSECDQLRNELVQALTRVPLVTIQSPSQVA
jgi:hypothetical protein